MPDSNIRASIIFGTNWLSGWSKRVKITIDKGSAATQNVWDSDFKGVWHLDEDPTSDWTRDSGNPIINAGFRSGAVELVKSGSTYHLYYYKYVPYTFCHATMTALNGTLTHDGDNPIFSAEAGEWRVGSFGEADLARR